MSDLFSPEQRAQAFGFVSASLGVGLAIGPSTIGYFGKTNFYIGLGIGLSSVVVSLFFLCFLKESLHYNKDPIEIALTKEKPFQCAPFANPFRTMSVIITKNNMYLTGLSILFILYSLGVTDLVSTLVLYTGYRYNWDVLQIGLCDSLLGVFMCINQGFLKQYEKRFGLRKLLIFGFVVHACSHIMYAFSFKWWMFVTTMALSSVGFTGHPTIQALITNAEAPSKRGAVLGAMGALQSLCTLVGGVVNDNLFAYFISGKAFILFPGPQFILGSIIFCIAAIGSVWLFRVYSEEKVAQTLTVSIRKEIADTVEEQPLLLND